jgi:DNA-binding response OmpR family regulator
MRILVVEHDKIVREFLTRSLVKSGFGVEALGLGSREFTGADCGFGAAGP